MENGKSMICCAILALGFGLAGWFMGKGFVEGRAAERYVTVKGISEREVTANVALWPLRFVTTNDDLQQAQEEMTKRTEAVLAFLKKYGIDPTSIESRQLEVKDLLADPYRDGPVQSRYIISQTLMVRTNDPKLVQDAQQHSTELVDAGVVLSGVGGAESQPTYLFTGLNEIKPAMIAEATANARQAAEQFAKDSGSRLAGIRKANQGLFEILARDRAQGFNEEYQLQKTVRVVSTIEYYLKD